MFSITLFYMYNKSIKGYRMSHGKGYFFLYNAMNRESGLRNKVLGDMKYGNVRESRLA